MRRYSGLIGILVLFPISLPAGETQTKNDFTEFSRLVHSLAVKQLPKQFEDNASWGQMIEVPANIPLPGLRKIVKVGDHLEAPHGAWRRSKGKIEDIDKNLKITVKDFKQLDEKTYRVVVDVDVTILCYAEWQQWQKGLLFFAADVTADANVTAAIVCDVGVSLNLTTFPPALNIEPKLTELGLDLADFKLRGDPIVTGEKGDALRKDLKEVLRTLLKVSEPAIKDHANRAIVQGLKQGKGNISADAILKAMPKK